MTNKLFETDNDSGPLQSKGSVRPHLTLLNGQVILTVLNSEGEHWVTMCSRHLKAVDLNCTGCKWGFWEDTEEPGVDKWGILQT